MKAALVIAITLVGGLVIAVVDESPADARRSEGIGWKYHEEGGGYYRDPEEPGPGPGRPIPDEDGWYYTTLVGYDQYQSDAYQDAGNRLECVDNPQFEGCQAAWYGCVGLWYEGTDEGRPAYPFQQFRQHVDWTDDGEFDPGGRLEDVGDGLNCIRVPDDDWVSQEDIWEVNYEVFQALGEPEIDFNPELATLVDLPTIASTDYPTADDLAEGDAVFISGSNPGEEPVTIEIPIVIPRPGQNFEGQITATADHEWHFEDGGTEPGRGKPYETGRLPRSNPDYYVTNTFTTTGTKTVELHLTWTGTVAVPGIGVGEPILPVEMDAATNTIDVREKRPVLTDN